MGRNKRRQLEVLDTRTNQIVLVDSGEEIEMYNFCLELLEYGVIKDFIYQPYQFKLSDKYTYFDQIKNKQCELFRPHCYSPDFKIIFNGDYIEYFGQYFKILQNQIENGKPYIVIDVKGQFQRFGGDRNFSVNAKWTFQKYGIYVQKVIPKECFHKLGVPKQCYILKNGKISKKYSSFQLLSEKINVNIKGNDN